jgi:hypothetical protein
MRMKPGVLLAVYHEEASRKLASAEVTNVPIEMQVPPSYTVGGNVD